VPSLTYTPVPSLLPLFRDTRSFWYVTVGPLGSGKTLATVMKMMQLSAAQPPGLDGIRRTRGVISRVTLPQIKTTVLRDIMDPGVLGPIARYRPSDNLITIDIGDMHVEWFLLPLETVVDQRRVLSMQLSYAYLNEAREVEFEIVNAVAGRVGRYPRTVDGGCTQPAMLADTNPPAAGSALHRFLTEPREGLRYIHQPGGLDPRADWLRYLPGGRAYYERLIVGQSRDWVDVHVHSKFGRDVSGQAVFGQVFDEQHHVKQDLKVMPAGAIVVGIDPGLNPAAVFMQPCPDGGVNVLKEVYAENMLFRSFLAEKVRPVLNSPSFIRRPYVMVMDPAGRNRSSLTGDTPYGICRKEGLPVKLASTNEVRTRILAVEAWLTRSVGKQPALRVDGRGCPILIEALARSYRYRRKREHGSMVGELEETPEKRHPVSDVADALQYGCLGLAARVAERADALSALDTGRRAVGIGPAHTTGALGWT
jgi:hypothetical protein